MPLKDGNGNFVKMTNNGAVKTVRVTTDNGNYNANFFVLIPTYTPPSSASLTLTENGGHFLASFPTQPGYQYQIVCKTNLTDAVWNPLGAPIVGNGSVQSLGDVTGGGSRFYRLQIQ